MTICHIVGNWSTAYLCIQLEVSYKFLAQEIMAITHFGFDGCLGLGAPTLALVLMCLKNMEVKTQLLSLKKPLKYGLHP
jgi:hypothetical protein